MLSARTGDKLRAISKVARTGRRVKDLRRLMNHPDLWMQAYLNIQGNKGALTRGTDHTTAGWLLTRTGSKPSVELIPPSPPPPLPLPTKLQTCR